MEIDRVELRAALRKRLARVEPESQMTTAELIVEAIVRKALNGDVVAAREIWLVTETDEEFAYES